MVSHKIFCLSNIQELVLRIRIRMFLGLLDPDPLVRGIDPDPYPDYSVIKQKKERKTLIPTVL
jgi:hypothetical protein